MYFVLSDLSNFSTEALYFTQITDNYSQVRTQAQLHISSCEATDIQNLWRNEMDNNTVYCPGSNMALLIWHSMELWGDRQNLWKNAMNNQIGHHRLAHLALSVQWNHKISTLL